MNFSSYPSLDLRLPCSKQWVGPFAIVKWYAFKPRNWLGATSFVWICCSTSNLQLHWQQPWTLFLQWDLRLKGRRWNYYSAFVQHCFWFSSWVCLVIKWERHGWFSWSQTDTWSECLMVWKWLIDDDKWHCTQIDLWKNHEPSVYPKNEILEP